MGFASLAPLVQPIQDDLDISYSKMGLVLGFWQLVTIFTFYPLGKLVDRHSPRILLAIAAIAVGASVALRGLAVDFTSLLMTVGLLGLAGPIISVGAPKVTANWFVGKQRNFAVAVYITGPMAGAMLGMSLATTVILPIVDSWREVMFIYGGIIMLAGIIWYILSRDRPYEASKLFLHENDKPMSLSSLLKIRNVRVVLVLSIAGLAIQHGVGIGWAPSILQHHAGMSLSEAGFWSGIAAGAGVVGTIIITTVAFTGIRRMIMAVLLLLTSVGLIGLSISADNLPVLSLMLIKFASSPMWPILTLILIDTDEIGHRNIGTAIGLAFAVAEIGGAGGPVLLGIIQDIQGSVIPGLMALSVLLFILVFTTPLIRESVSKNNNNQSN